MWLPRFVCPECQTQVQETGIERFACADCGSVFDRRNGVWRFLSAPRGARLEPFIRQYRVIREREGRRLSSPAYYRRLPEVVDGDPHAAEWQIRRETYHHLLAHVLDRGAKPVRVLDVGAGNGWLSHRLSTSGHRTVAVDAIDDAVDGLGATRHYSTRFVVVQADFEALPFAPGQFEIVVFNGSLHYAADPVVTLERTQSLLAPEGALVVTDSPMFRADADGSAMVEAKMQSFVREYGLTDVVQQGTGYLTFDRLARVAEKLALRSQFVPSSGSLGWRLRRSIARVRLHRAPAAFGLWVAR